MQISKQPKGYVLDRFVQQESAWSLLDRGNYDRHVYNSLLKEQVWPMVKGVATRQKLYFMQNGATCHTVAENLAFLCEKFGGCVISNKTDIPWPANSPDLNPLDFFSPGGML